MPNTTTPQGWQPTSLHDAALIVLLKAKRAQIERRVAAHLHHVDVLTGAHFYLTQSLRRIERRAHVAAHAASLNSQGDINNWSDKNGYK